MKFHYQPEGNADMVELTEDEFTTLAAEHRTDARDSDWTVRMYSHLSEPFAVIELEGEPDPVPDERVQELYVDSMTERSRALHEKFVELFDGPISTLDIEAFGAVIVESLNPVVGKLFIASLQRAIALKEHQTQQEAGMGLQTLNQLLRGEDEPDPTH